MGEILNLFRIDFANPVTFARKLPLAFMEGVQVWRRLFALGVLPKGFQQKILDHDGQFCVVVISSENPRILTEHFS